LQDWPSLGSLWQVNLEWTCNLTLVNKKILDKPAIILQQ